MLIFNKKWRVLSLCLFTAALALTSLTFVSCGGDTEDGYKICLFGADTSKTWNVWAWKETGSKDEEYSTKSWPGGDIQLTKTDSDYGYIYTYMDVDTSYPLGILFVDSTGSSKTEDIEVPVSTLTSTTELYFVYGSKTYYTSADDVKGLYNASVTAISGSSLTITGTVIGASSVSASDFTVTNSSGASKTVTSAALSGTALTLTVTAGKSDLPLTLIYNSVSTSVTYSADCIDDYVLPSSSSEIAALAQSLGVSISDSSATFKTWAPTAGSVSVLLYASSSDAYDSSRTASFDAPGSTTTDWKKTSYTPKEVSMSLGDNGVWSVEDVDVSSYSYYKYKIKIANTTYYVSDIWHTVAGPDSAASQIADIDSSEATPSSWETSYTNPFGSSGNETKSYSDAVIYEMHVRDWSRAVDSSSTGKFLTICGNDTATVGSSTETIIEHLKDLGVTHVQILPMFDYAQLNSDTDYNWGYNPYHYNVPEGRYVTDSYTDGTQAVLELRTMVKALHDAGIAVIMDVVYNHTSGTLTGSLYDSTVPGYFYRMSNGSYSNGSGCGNELATNHAMVKQYVIESLKHWMNDYHINGFRFDLMGCFEASTMKDIYDELYAIDKNVLVYGEPWTGGTSAVSGGATAAGKGTSGIGYGAFDDDFRDAIKGGEYGGFKQGHVQGTFSDSGIIKGLTGASCTRNSTGLPELSLHYVECHDNYTLFDKLAISALNKTSYSGNLFTAASSYLDTIKSEDKLAAAFVLLSQGTPFINGGQEFLRTKQGNENSYNASDTINQINLGMKSTYSEVYNTYKALIALRKEYSSSFGNLTDSSATKVKVTSGVTKYTAGSFTVYFNATSDDYSLSDTGYEVTIDEESGAYSVAGSTSTITSVPAKGFVIIKNS